MDKVMRGGGVVGGGYQGQLNRAFAEQAGMQEEKRGASTVEPAGEVGQQMAAVRGQALGLSQAVYALAERLEAVLLPLPPEPCTGLPCAPEPGCKLAAEVQQVAVQLQQTRDMVDSLVARVQV